jgi:hypothetical protein
MSLTYAKRIRRRPGNRPPAPLGQESENSVAIGPRADPIARRKAGTDPLLRPHQAFDLPRRGRLAVC